MAEIYNVGPDTVYEEKEILQDERFLWVVYWYESGSYEGDGEAVALHTDGTLHTFSLSHCSCYGPFEDWGNSTSKGMTIKEFMREKDSIFDLDFKEEVKVKVKELLKL
jgi:hypothetical protein